LKGPRIPEPAIHIQLDLRALNPRKLATPSRKRKPPENERQPPPRNSHKTTADEGRPLPPHARNCFAVASSVQLPHLDSSGCAKAGNEPLTAAMVERRTRIEGSYGVLGDHHQGSNLLGSFGRRGGCANCAQALSLDTTRNISRLLLSTMSNMKSRLKS
jgi:hypothetical protein